eukprot:14332996-Alexandrium_andersonii.AAC.1
MPSASRTGSFKLLQAASSCLFSLSGRLIIVNGPAPAAPPVVEARSVDQVLSALRESVASAVAAR